MYESLINYPHITDYLRTNISPLENEVWELEKELRSKEKLPIIKPESARFLSFLCGLQKPKKILEIGACVGFSALLMRSVCPPDTRITTIDRYDYMISRAKENFKRFGADNITLLEGQAADILPTLSDKYDLIFLDAAKGQYPAFLPHCLRLLSDDGVFIADNILFDGLVAECSRSSRRDMTIVKRLRSFLETLVNDENLVTSIIPIGDGMVAVRKK